MMIQIEINIDQFPNLTPRGMYVTLFEAVYVLYWSNIIKGCSPPKADMDNMLGLNLSYSTYKEGQWSKRD